MPAHAVREPCLVCFCDRWVLRQAVVDDLCAVSNAVCVHSLNWEQPGACCFAVSRLHLCCQHTGSATCTQCYRRHAHNHVPSEPAFDSSSGLYCSSTGHEHLLHESEMQQRLGPAQFQACTCTAVPQSATRLSDGCLVSVCTRQASKLRVSPSRSRLRPMKTILLTRFSFGSQGGQSPWVLQVICSSMWTPWKTYLWGGVGKRRVLQAGEKRASAAEAEVSAG